MQRYLHGTIGLLITLSLLLAGCGDGSSSGGSGSDTGSGSGGSSAGEAGAETGSGGGADEAKVVHVYSHRHYEADKQLYAAFTEKTGIEVKVKSGKAGSHIKTLAEEGERTEADVLITVDAGRLHEATSKGLLQPTQSEELEALCPAPLRDPQGHWFGLTVRARVIVYSKERVKPGDITTYADLADPKWKGKVLIRQSNNVYNQSLLASIIAHEGPEKAEAWAKGVVANFARTPKGNDRAQVKAVAAGTGDLAVVNTYYIGIMLSDEAQKPAAEAVGILFPDQDGRGAHINVSGAGVVKHAKHPNNARKLIAFLLSDEAQKVYTKANHEFPVRESIEPSALLKSWGSFKRDQLSIAKLGELNQAARDLFAKVDWP